MDAVYLLYQEDDLLANFLVLPFIYLLIFVCFCYVLFCFVLDRAAYIVLNVLKLTVQSRLAWNSQRSACFYFWVLGLNWKCATISDPFIFVVVFETKSQCIALADLEFVTKTRLTLCLCLCLPNTRTLDVYQKAQCKVVFIQR